MWPTSSETTPNRLENAPAAPGMETWQSGKRNGFYLFTGVRGRIQPVEKVGAELKIATDRASEAPKSPQYGVFGARSGVEAGIEGVFQQAGQFSEVGIQESA